MYKETWTPSLGNEHDCQRKRGNPQDPYAVAVSYALTLRSSGSCS